MKVKILVYAFPVLILTTIHLAEAQLKKVPRIGVLIGGPAASTDDQNYDDQEND